MKQNFLLISLIIVVIGIIILVKCIGLPPDEQNKYTNAIIAFFTLAAIVINWINKTEETKEKVFEAIVKRFKDLEDEIYKVEGYDTHQNKIKITQRYLDIIEDSLEVDKKYKERVDLIEKRFVENVFYNYLQKNMVLIYHVNKGYELKFTDAIFKRLLERFNNRDFNVKTKPLK